jgi:hypothetical protein
VTCRKPCQGPSSKWPARKPHQGDPSETLFKVVCQGHSSRWPSGEPFKGYLQGALSEEACQGCYPKRPVRGLFKVVNQGWFQGGLSRPSSRWPVRSPFQGGLSGPGPYSRPPCLVPDQDGLSGALFKSGLSKKGLRIIVCQGPYLKTGLSGAQPTHWPVRGLYEYV